MEFRTLENAEKKINEFLDKVEKRSFYGPADIAAEEITVRDGEDKNLYHVVGYKIDLFEVDHSTSEIYVLCGIENGEFYQYSDRRGKKEITKEEVARILLDFCKKNITK